MRKIIGWVLPVIGLATLGLALYLVKLEHDLGEGLQEDFNRRFAAASAQAIVVDEGSGSARALNEHDRVLIGQTVVAELLMGVRVVSYYAERGTVPTSIEEIDSNTAGRQQSMPDPWGKPFRIVREDRDRFVIISGGPSGTTVLTTEEWETLKNQTVGRTYMLHGKIVLNGFLPMAPDQNQRTRPATQAR